MGHTVIFGWMKFQDDTATIRSIKGVLNFPELTNEALDAIEELAFQTMTEYVILGLYEGVIKLESSAEFFGSVENIKRMFGQ